MKTKGQSIAFTDKSKHTGRLSSSNNGYENISSWNVLPTQNKTNRKAQGRGLGIRVWKGRKFAFRLRGGGGGRKGKEEGVCLRVTSSNEVEYRGKLRQ